MLVLCADLKPLNETNELTLIAQGWKSTDERATGYWRQKQKPKEDKGDRNAREIRRLLERGYWRCFPNAQRSLGSGSGGHGSVRRGDSIAADGCADPTGPSDRADVSSSSLAAPTGGGTTPIRPLATASSCTKRCAAVRRGAGKSQCVKRAARACRKRTKDCVSKIIVPCWLVRDSMADPRTFLLHLQGFSLLHYFTF